MYETISAANMSHTSIKDYMSYANEENIYAIIPCRKQNITFTFSDGEGVFDVKILDRSNNVISEYLGLGVGSSFELNDTMKDYEYRICVTGQEIAEYVLEVEY